jgi:hypothetical protein
MIDIVNLFEAAFYLMQISIIMFGVRKVIKFLNRS